MLAQGGGGGGIEKGSSGGGHLTRVGSTGPDGISAGGGGEEKLHQDADFGE